MRDKTLIPVDDIDEIEHTEGLQFLVHYQQEPPTKSDFGGGQKKVKDVVGVAITGFISKINKAKKETPMEEPLKKVEKSILLESKHVKTIIETFNNVLSIVDQQERELNLFIKQQESSDEDDSKIKVFEARIIKDEKPKEEKKENLQIPGDIQKSQERKVVAEEEEYYDEEIEN